MHTAYCKCCNAVSLGFTGVRGGLTNSRNNENAPIANKEYKPKANSIAKEVSSQADSSVTRMHIKFSATHAQLFALYHPQQRNSSCVFGTGEANESCTPQKLQPAKPAKIFCVRPVKEEHKNS